MTRSARRARAIAVALLAPVVLLAARPAEALLSVSATDVDFPDVTLDGTDRTTSAIPLSLWTIVDARGTGAPWTVTIAATTPTSAGGSVETAARTVSVGNLTVSTGLLTAALGSDPTTNITGSTDLTLSTSPQTIVSSTGSTTGTYTFTPTFSILMPANAYRSNYAGTVGSSTLNPYVSDLTVTIS